MSGNVLEWWCKFDDNYQGVLNCVVWATKADGPRVVRGGSWGDEPWWLRSAARLRSDPRIWNYYSGFRLARTFNPLTFLLFPFSGVQGGEASWSFF